MEFSSFTATGPRIFSFSDVDEFRNSVRGWKVDFTPLARAISARQVILNLPGCAINVVESFPRLLDLKLSPNCTAVGFAMDDGAPIRFDGMEYDRTSIVLGGNEAACSVIERSGRRFGFVVFTPEVQDREWPTSGNHFSMVGTTGFALRRLQQLVLEILSTPLQAPNKVELDTISAAIRESLLAAIDEVLSARGKLAGSSTANSIIQYRIFQSIEASISRNLAGPIYSAQLAKQVGVSVRTLHNAIHRYRGMSLHRYLRLRRLWLVRQRLLAGASSVKATALAMGFWHLSDFSRSYRIAFGEMPSETLARSK